MPIAWPLVVVNLLAFAGFLLALYIHHKKSLSEPMICPLGADCETVIHSQYARFFGWPVERLGLVYYASLVLVYALIAAFPTLAWPGVVFLLVTLTLLASLFSAYLIFIQAVVLKQWCSWCLLSALFCFGIFGLVGWQNWPNYLASLAVYRMGIVLLHLLGVALGLGAATITDIFFFRFLRDFRIAQSEAAVLNTLSQVIWFALAVIVVSGLGLYLPQAATLNHSAKFLVKMIAVGVIVANGAGLNLLIAPKLMRISFGGKHEHQPGELHRDRRLAFALGAISVTSWYAAFILGSLRESPMPFLPLVSVYGLLLVIAVVASQLVERYFDWRAKIGGWS